MTDHGGRLLLRAQPLDKNADGDSLLDIEDIFVLRSVRTALLLLTVAVQIEKIDLVEGPHETLAHSPDNAFSMLSMYARSGAMRCLFL